jgi:hypothetical protein
MRKGDLILSAIILLAVNLAWMVRCERGRKEQLVRAAGLMESSYRLDRDNKLILSAYLNSAGSELSRLLSYQQVVDGEIQSGILYDYIGTSSKLILLLSDRNCSTCIDDVLFRLKKVSFRIGVENILVAYIRFDSPETVWHQRSLIIPEIKFIELKEQDAITSGNVIDLPFLFLAGPSMKTDMAYIYLPSMDDPNEKYFEMVANRFQHSEKP